MAVSTRLPPLKTTTKKRPKKGAALRRRWLHSLGSITPEETDRALRLLGHLDDDGAHARAFARMFGPEPYDDIRGGPWARCDGVAMAVYLQNHQCEDAAAIVRAVIAIDAARPVPFPNRRPKKTTQTKSAAA